MSIPALSRYPVYLCQLLKRDKHGYILWGGLLAPYLSLSLSHYCRLPFYYKCAQTPYVPGSRLAIYVARTQLVSVDRASELLFIIIR